MGVMSQTLIVIPCYNEALRLNRAEFSEFAGHGDIELVLVDDGSTDDTAECLRQICSHLDDRASFLSLGRNSGKGEAVRIGMLRAIERGAEIVGFADADFSTPATEILRLAGCMKDSTALVVMGSRIQLLGSDVRRRPLRHFTGRMFATYASAALKLRVYDTQCGAKFFRVTPTLINAIEKPFKSRWAFDVELIGRLMGADGELGYSADNFLEIPLRQWRDVKGSKLTIPGVLHALVGVFMVGWALRTKPSGKAAWDRFNKCK